MIARPRIVLAIVLGLAAIAAPAAAQRAPDFATLDRGDGFKRVGLDAGFTLLDQAPYDAGLRLELALQWVLRSGLGFYGAFPIARSFGGGAPGPEAAFGIGNLEAGLLYVIQGETLSWVFRGGVALPTSSGGDGAPTNAYSTFPRLTDLALTVHDAIYVRVAFSPLIHMDHFYARADIGFDAGMDDADQANELVRLNLGAGYDFGTFALGVEWVNLYSLDTFGPNDDYLHTIALNGRFMGKTLQPYVAVGIPLDDSQRDVATFFIAAGIQYIFK